MRKLPDWRLGDPLPRDAAMIMRNNVDGGLRTWTADEPAPTIRATPGGPLANVTRLDPFPEP